MELSLAGINKEEGAYMRHDRPPTLTEIRLKEANKNLLDTQELTASLFEENANLKSQLLVTQTIVTTLTEGGTV